MKSRISDNELLSFMEKQNTYISAARIAATFNVAVKTIYRHVNIINQKGAGTIIKSAKGKGYRLSKSFAFKKGQRNAPFSSEKSPQNRRKNVILKVLFNSPQPIYIYDLFKNEYVSESTINADLLKIKKILLKSNLKLIQKNKRISVQGKEDDIREKINSLLHWHKEKNNRVPIDGINEIDLVFIQEQINIIEQLSKTKIPYPYDINICSHIYILIQRLRKQTDKSYSNKVTVSKEEIAQNYDLYRISEIVIENVGKYIVKDISKFEINYLFKYLLSSRFIGKTADHDPKFLYSEKVETFTTRLIERVNKKINAEIDEPILKKELISHIGPMMNRIENNISVENELLPDIKVEYKDLYQVIAQECWDLCLEMQVPKISENELGFITLYFEKNIEEITRKYHVWVVCASGVGTSELLKLKIQKEFGNIVVDKVISSLDEQLLRSENSSKIDLIISTVELPHYFANKYVLVSAMLNQQDKEKIKNAIYR